MLRRTLLEHGAASVLVGVGGALGTYARYATELAVEQSLLATLVGNVAGCFLLGLLLFDRRAAAVLSKRHRLVFGTGFCASFTTYSTFVLDVVTTAPTLAVAYVAASYLGGFAAVLASRRVLTAVGSTPVEPPTATGER